MVSPVDAEAPSSRDYFELFQIPVAFDVDVDDLARRFKLLQKQFHPDRFAGKSAAEQRVAAQMSAELNAGYQTLKHEVKRAGYMLQRYGVDLSQLEREPVDGEFLLQQIELREQAEALREEATSRDANVVEQLHQSAFALYQSNVAAFRLAVGDGKLESAGKAWVKLLYLAKLRRELPALGGSEVVSWS